MSLYLGYSQKVEIEYAEELGGVPERRILRGAVRLRQDSILLLCQQAILTEDGGFIGEGSTMTLIGRIGQIKAQRLRYDPQQRRLTYEGDVQADFPPVSLRVPQLHYDRESALIWYEGGGTLTDTAGEIYSERGQYDTQANLATFAGNVRVKKGTIHARTDSLIYQSDIYYAISPTFIEVWDEETGDTLSASQSEWNRLTSELFLKGKVFYRNREGALRAAWAYHDMKRDSGHAACEVRYADRKGSEFGWGDSACWLQDAFSFWSNAAFLSVGKQDSTFLQADRVHWAEGLLSAIGQAEFMRPPLLSRSDTLRYDTLARLAFLSGHAWITSQTIQLYADRIYLRLSENGIDSASAIGNVRLIAVADSLLEFYHQIQGDSAIAIGGSDGTLRRLRFMQNLQILYYQSEEERWQGAHHIYAGHVYLEIDSLQRPLYVRVEGRPRGTFYPVHKLVEAPLWIRGFEWMSPHLQPSWPFWKSCSPSDSGETCPKK
ncbi:MAG: OstA-like protein [Bacteroidia bacterium]|nr:hypothetical protein [Bacteroidia bacterium]MDW8014972.1 OstA-like protein [Bacteroidia bacterium]